MSRWSSWSERRRQENPEGHVTRAEFRSEQRFSRRAILAAFALALGLGLVAVLGTALVQRERDANRDQAARERARIQAELCSAAQGYAAAQVPRDQRAANLLAKSRTATGRELGALFAASADFGRRFAAADCDHLPDELLITARQERERAKASQAPAGTATTPSTPTTSSRPVAPTTSTPTAPPSANPNPRPEPQPSSPATPTPSSGAPTAPAVPAIPGVPAVPGAPSPPAPPTVVLPPIRVCLPPILRLGDCPP